MAVRLSFTLDPELSERIDEFAKVHNFDRNEAVLRLIEAGLVKAAEDGFIAPLQTRDFRTAERMQKNIDSMMTTIEDLKKEVRVMHHIIDLRDNVEQEKKLPLRMRKKWL